MERVERKRNVVIKVINRPSSLGEEVAVEMRPIIDIAKVEKKLSEAQEIGEELWELYKKVETIFPESGAKSKIRSVLTRIPVIGKIIEKDIVEFIEKNVENIDEQVNRLSVQITRIGDEVLKDNVKLEKLKKEINAKIKELNREIAVGEEAEKTLSAVISRLEKAYEKAENGWVKEAVEAKLKILRDRQLILSQRIADLLSLRETFKNLIISANQLLNTSELVLNLLSRLSSTGIATIATTIVIKKAAYDQERALEVGRTVNKYINELIVKNAEAIKSNTELAGKLFEEPIVTIETLINSLEKLKESYKHFEDVRRLGIENIRKTAERLKELGEETDRFITEVEKNSRKEER